MKAHNPIDDGTTPTRASWAVKAIVDLTEEQSVALDDLCRKRRISRAEAIRGAIDTLLQSDCIPAQDVGFGAWRARREGSLEIVGKLRGEWDKCEGL